MKADALDVPVAIFAFNRPRLTRRVFDAIAERRPKQLFLVADGPRPDRPQDGAACAEFSWEGFDDDSPASGRGWAALGTAGRLVGHIFIHRGDDSGFVAIRE